MTTYALLKGNAQLKTTEADNIDQAVDIFFADVQVDVDLDTCTTHRLDVRPLRQRKSLPSFVIQELP